MTDAAHINRSFEDIEDAPGTAQGWTLTSIASLWEFAEFGTGLDYPGAYEYFALGWPSSPGAEGDTTELDEDALIEAWFGFGFLENFVWFGDGPALSATIAATFDVGLEESTFEMFSQGWPTVPGSESDSTSLGTVVDAVFDSSEIEEFGTGWLGNEDDGVVPVGLIDMVVGQGGTMEDFAPFTSIHTEVEIFQVTTGNIYQININGEELPYVAQAGDTTSVVATELVAAINGSPQEVSAVAVGPRVQITNTSFPFVVGIHATQPTQIAKIYTGAVQPNAGWTGTAANLNI